MKKLKPKNGDAQKKRSSCEVRGVSPEAGRESMVGKICERGRYQQRLITEHYLNIIGDAGMPPSDFRAFKNVRTNVYDMMDYINVRPKADV